MSTESRKSKLLGNHQKSWIWGRHVVLETLRAGRWIPVEIRAGESLDVKVRDELEAFARDHNVPIGTDSDTRLKELCKADDHQGCLARMPAFPYVDADEVLNAATGTPAFALIAGVQDPHNLGAILRSAEVFGLDAVFLAATGQVGITSLVARTSVGAVNHLPIARVDVATLIDNLQSQEITVAATTPDGGEPIDQVDFNKPTAIVIGGESTGLPAEILGRCEAHVSIPQHGSLDSLNAAVAAGVVFYEIARQRRSRK